MSPAVAQRWPVMTAEERIEASTRPDASGCLIWTGNISPDGYGRLVFDGRLYLAHRFVYEQRRGPIPDGLTLDHLCRNRACVNPDHLEPVTLAENKARGFSRPAINARKTQCPRGHVYDNENTYYAPTGGRICRACRRENVRRGPVTGRICEAPGCSNEIPAGARLDRRTCSSACRQRRGHHLAKEARS